MNRAQQNVPQKRHTPAQRAMRARAIERTGELMGKGRLAEALGVPDRTLRAYMAIERGIPDAVLHGAAAALAAYTENLAAHAEKLRSLVRPVEDASRAPVSPDRCDGTIDLEEYLRVQRGVTPNGK